MKKFHNIRGGIVGVLLLCSACADKDKVVLEQESSPYILFEKGNEYISKHKYADANRYFEQIERDHPASDLASVAQIRHAFSLYELGKFDDSIIVINEFIHQYPAHPNADYMYYLKALCYYDQIVDVGRDQKLTELAMDAIDEAISLFPRSIYVKDMKLKREFAVSSLAGKEMEVANYYGQVSDLIAAAGRYKNVVNNYDTSIFTPEALYRLTEIYTILGVKSEAMKYAAVLGYNYPKSKWYYKAYALLDSKDKVSKVKKKGLLQKIW